jgi:hypothetical protein
VRLDFLYETKIFNGGKSDVEQTILRKTAKNGMDYLFVPCSREHQQKGSTIEAGINGRI